jgi:prepilin-type processing-associated H-X9-DG protein
LLSPPLIKVPYYSATNQRDRRSDSAFTRLDLIIVILILSILGGILYAFGINTDSRRNLALCTANLRSIGAGFTGYVSDHNRALPYASIQTNGGSRATWDFALRYYLTDGALGTNSTFSLEARAQGQELAKMFRCPADTIPRDQGNRPRSYAMPFYLPNPKNWPPSSSSETGVGLQLAIRENEKGELMLPKWRQKTETNGLTVITTDIITAPSDTLLVTEKAQAGNQLYMGGMNPVIKSTAEHLDTNHLASIDYHGGRFNYLMIDGHVETLTPDETVGWSGTSGSAATSHKGIWTIKAGD